MVKVERGRADNGSTTPNGPSIFDSTQIGHQKEQHIESLEALSDEEIASMLGAKIVDKKPESTSSKSEDKNTLDRRIKRTEKLGKTAIVATLAGASGLGAIAGAAVVASNIFGKDKGNPNNAGGEPTQEILTVNAEEGTTASENRITDPSIFYGDSNPNEMTVGSEHEKVQVDGYGNTGMWLSGNKERPFNYADASEVAKVNKNSERGMVTYTGINEIEPQASYSFFMPNELKSDELKNLDMLQMADVLDTLASDQSEEGQKKFAEANKVFSEAIRNADVDHPTLTGDFYSAYIGYEDENGNILNRDQAIQLEGAEFTHENMKLMQSVVHLDHQEVTRFTFKDNEGNIIKDKEGNPYTLIVMMTPVYDSDGNITGYKGCIQPLSSKKIKGVKVVNQEGDIFVPVDPGNPPEEFNPPKEGPKPTPTPTPKPKPTPTPTPEWGKTGDPHAEAPGYEVTYSDWVDPNASVTYYENAITNQGNQGYVDDGGAIPGEASHAENEYRNEGGEVVGSTDLNGVNPYTPTQEVTVDAGNVNQQIAQETAKPGGDNNSDAAEEAAVESGNF